MANRQTQKPKPPEAFIKQRRKAIAITTAAILIPILTYDIFFMGGNLPLYAKWIECGQKPVVIHGSGMNTQTPHHTDPPNFSAFRWSVTYLCTPLEAERAGYSANSGVWYFPELNKIGEEPPEKILSPSEIN